MSAAAPSRSHERSQRAMMLHMRSRSRAGDGRASRRVRGLPWWAILLLGLAVLLAIQELAWVLFAPWAVGWLPGPKLIGTYGGELEAEQGARYSLLLELEPKYQRTGPGNPRSTNLQGRAQLCTPTGARFAYTVSGFANRNGD